jgi:hypothetical protein
MASGFKIVWPNPDLIREPPVGYAIRAGDCQLVSLWSCGHCRRERQSMDSVIVLAVTAAFAQTGKLGAAREGCSLGT